MKNAKRVSTKFRLIMITPNKILNLLRDHNIFINRLFMFTEDGAIIFQLKLDHDRSILAYFLAKALLYGLGISRGYDASLDELSKIPSVNLNALPSSLDSFSHESEKLILMTNKGYCLNPIKEKIEEIIFLIKDYLIVSGQEF